MTKHKLFAMIVLAAVGVGLLASYLTHSFVFSDEREPLRLAVVAPLTGDEAALGQALREGVELETVRINQAGGLNGRKIKVLTFDDGNNPERAVAVAREVIGSGVMAVIGHTRAVTLAAAEPLYAAAKLPMLTLAADVLAKPKGEVPFAARLLSDETYEIRFLANYLRNVIGEKSVHLLYEESPRGVALASAFDETMQRFGTRVVYRWALTPGSANLKTQAAAAARELLDGKLPGTVLVIADPADSAQAVSALRSTGLRNAIAGTRSFATDSFIEVLKHDWQGPGSVESTINGSLLTAPMLYDVSGAAAQNFRTDFIAQFNHAPDWIAAYASDAARLLLTSLQSELVNARIADDELRTHLAQRLTDQVSSGKPIDGINGPIVLNAQGRDIHPPLIGTYDGIDLISTLIQLVPIREEGVGDLLQQFIEGRALYVNDRFMYRTNVVYAGVRPANVSQLYVREGTVEQEFQVWFRWRGDFEPQDIVFSNAVTPIRLEKPEHEAKTGDMQYRSYRVKGKFFINFSTVRRAFDTKLIGVSFSHRLLSRHNLMYVTDVLGMGMTRNNTLQTVLEASSMVTGPKDEEGIQELIGQAIHAIRKFLYADSSLGDPLIKLLSRTNLLAGTPGWIIDKAWLSQDIVSRSSEGDPKFVGFGRPSPEFSKVEMGAILKPDLIRARDVIPGQYFLYIAILSFIGAVLAVVLDRRKTQQDWRVQTFFIRLVTWPLLLIAVGNLLLDYALLYASSSVINSIWMFYQVAHWFVPAALVAIAMERFLWAPLEKRTQRKIPNIIRLLSALVVFVVALVGVVANVFEQTITSILATTGLSAMIVGLAIKDSIANVFAGIIINLEKPFGIGDFIKVGNTVGKVVDITWRTTRIEVDAGHIVSLPNAKISEAELHNLSRTSAGVSCELKVMVDSDLDPELVRPLLAEAIKGCKQILTDKDGVPDVKVSVGGVKNENQAWITTYSVSFNVKMMPHFSKVKDYFWPRLWKQFHEAGVSWKAGEDMANRSHVPSATADHA